MAPVRRISLRDFIAAVSDSIRTAAERLAGEESLDEAPIALVRVRVRFSAGLERRRRWPRAGEVDELYLSFRPDAQTNIEGELYFGGDGEPLWPLINGHKGADSNGSE